MTAHPIPDAALDDRLGFLGMTGSGKTFGAGTCVERILTKRGRVIIPDPLGVWWGLRQMADGVTASPYEIVIFGGPHADLPLTPAAGAIIGETVAGMRESAIIDLSQFETAASERRFMLAFLEALYRRSTGEPVHVIFDEADLWAPEKILDKEGDATKLHGMMQSIVRRGRIKGLTSWLVSQRPASLSKQVLSQVDGLVAFRLTASQDRRALGLWIEGQADREAGKAILGRLPEKHQGEAVVWLPAHGVLADVMFPPKQTYDSSRAPKRGEKTRKVDLKPLDLGALKERLSTVEQEAKANDPKLLKAEVVRLTREMQKAATNIPKNIPAHDPLTIEAAEKRGYDQAIASVGERMRRALVEIEPAVDEARLAARGLLQEAAAVASARFDGISDTIAALIGKAVAELGDLAAPVKSTAKYSNPIPARGRAHTLPVQRIKRDVDSAPKTKVSGANGHLPPGERAVLIAAAQFDGVAREQLTVLTGYKRSTRDAYIQRLREKGYIEVDGQTVRATQVGLDGLPADYEPLPIGVDLQNYWLGRLPEGERRILQVLIESYPGSVARSDLDDATGFKRSTRDAYLQRMKAKRLWTGDGSAVRAAEELFP